MFRYNARCCYRFTQKVFFKGIPLTLVFQVYLTWSHQTFWKMMSNPWKIDQNHGKSYMSALWLQMACTVSFVVICRSSFRFYVFFGHPLEMLGNEVTKGINSSPLDKMAAISQTTFSSAFSWMKILIFWLKFDWSLFLRVHLTITQHWFR